uniref:ALK and LTK ligand 1 n=1 Tax=Crocodylus porosus TaxID=8502 RepID=A0A7M4FI58_CROPO
MFTYTYASEFIESSWCNVRFVINSCLLYYLIGPVTFSAECSKHFHRLYHNTRDCSTPAYYKRCARLLTRLAMSPLCTQS